jgi:hypothetical protein
MQKDARRSRLRDSGVEPPKVRFPLRPILRFRSARSGRGAWAATGITGGEGPQWVDSGLSRRNIRDLAASLKTPQFSASNRKHKKAVDQPRFSDKSVRLAGSARWFVGHVVTAGQPVPK